MYLLKQDGQLQSGYHEEDPRRISDSRSTDQSTHRHEVLHVRFHIFARSHRTSHHQEPDWTAAVAGHVHATVSIAVLRLRHVLHRHRPAVSSLHGPVLRLHVVNDGQVGRLRKGAALEGDDAHDGTEQRRPLARLVHRLHVNHTPRLYFSYFGPRGESISWSV